MRTISIHRAQGHAHASDGPEPVTIIIEAPFPTNGAGDSYFHTTDATTLAEALHATLAGGTWDRLVAEMLRLHASNLIVTRPQQDDPPPPPEVVGVAFDNRTGHYWEHRKGNRLPSCRTCGLWMTDWSLINTCGTTLVPASNS